MYFVYARKVIDLEKKTNIHNIAHTIDTIRDIDRYTRETGEDIQRDKRRHQTRIFI